MSVLPFGRLGATGRTCGDVLILLWVVLCLQACSRQTDDVQHLSFSLPTLDDPHTMLELGNLSEPAVVNLWASWCVPCRKEMPQLHALRRDHDVALYGLNYRDDPEDARRWLAFYGNPFHRIGIDPVGRQLAGLAKAGVPQTFFVDRAGRVQFHHIGALTDPEVIGDLVSAVKRLEPNR
jgi:cytochrome c biogenesis protein CcmG/thiol:disulfide interchange protein DsbE